MEHFRFREHFRNKNTEFIKPHEQGSHPKIQNLVMILC